jgi:diaminopimelate decarboxylase
MASVGATDTRFALAENQAWELAERFGTPLYVLDESHLRSRARAWKTAWPHGDLSYASKANSTLAVLRIMASEGLSIDVASEGELRAALKAGVPAHQCRLHGNNKTWDEVTFAAEVGVGKAIVDNFEELGLWQQIDSGTPLLLRLAPGVDPKTNAKISTGQADTKFGFPITDGQAMEALRIAIESGLNVVGFHCHVGSQLLDPGAQVQGGVQLALFARAALDELGFVAEVINVGGGLGVRYTESDDPLPINEYCERLYAALAEALSDSLSPELAQEPGRSLVAESGVTLYRVGAVKTPAIGDRYVVVDGGLSDNPRPALYGSAYEVRPIGANGPGVPSRVSGKHCETDLLFSGLELPDDLGPGHLLQVLCTGAYNSSMASQYNRFPRPATVLIRENGRPDLVQARDDWESMFARERLPEDL